MILKSKVNLVVEKQCLEKNHDRNCNRVCSKPDCFIDIFIKRNLWGSACYFAGLSIEPLQTKIISIDLKLTFEVYLLYLGGLVASFFGLCVLDLSETVTNVLKYILKEIFKKLFKNIKTVAFLK